MKKILLFAFLISVSFALSAQTADTNSDNATNTTNTTVGDNATNTTLQGPGYVSSEQIKGDNPNEKVQEVVISKLESFDNFQVQISNDYAFSTIRRVPGGPEQKTPDPGEKYSIAGPDEYVIGVKVDFTNRGISPLRISTIKPINLPGVVKTIQIWIAGRGYKDKLNVILQDKNGKTYKIFMGEMNYQGWKRLTAAIPDNIEQLDNYTGDFEGLKFIGFEVDFDYLHAKGTRYIYMDDLRATTDLFYEFNKDPDDVVDNW